MIAGMTKHIDHVATFRLPREQHDRMIAAAKELCIPYAELVRRGMELAIAVAREEASKPPSGPESPRRPGSPGYAAQ